MMNAASLLPASPVDVLTDLGAHSLHGDDNLHLIEWCAPKSAAAKFRAPFVFAVQVTTARVEEFCG